MSFVALYHFDGVRQSLAIAESVIRNKELAKFAQDEAASLDV